MKWSIEDFVDGATDGAVTTFAFVAGGSWSRVISFDYFDIGFQIYLQMAFQWQ